MKHKFAFVTTCMGRLAHLKQSIPPLMADPRLAKDWIWVLVDYACPDKSGDWAEAEFGERAKILRIPSVEKDATVVFNKPLALNSGAMHAISEGAEYLVFLDADALITTELLDALDAYASPDAFLIIRPNLEKKDLTGFLCVNHRHFMRMGGYDIEFEGWGAEDLEFRIRLYLKGGIPFQELPCELANSIPHEDALRTAHYEKKDKQASHNLNLNLLCANVFRWTGKHPVQHYQESAGPYLRRLLGIDPLSPAELLLP